MTSTSVSDWDNEYARVARQASQLRSRVNLIRDGPGFRIGSVSRTSSSNPSLNPPNPSLGEADRRTLAFNLQRLKQLLPSLPLTHADLQRRLTLMNHLQQQLQPTQNSLQQQEQMSGSISNSNYNNALLQQDEMLDDLAHGVERLKHQSILIGDEAKLHLNLLGDMENQVDVAQTGLEGETRRADGLRENSVAIWKLQLIVVGLTIVLVMLILTGLT